jgi:hypothetical protein
MAAISLHQFVAQLLAKSVADFHRRLGASRILPGGSQMMDGPVNCPVNCCRSTKKAAAEICSGIFYKVSYRQGFVI